VLSVLKVSEIRLDAKLPTSCRIFRTVLAKAGYGVIATNERVPAADSLQQQ